MCDDPAVWRPEVNRVSCHSCKAANMVRTNAAHRIRNSIEGTSNFRTHTTFPTNSRRTTAKGDSLLQMRTERSKGRRNPTQSNRQVKGTAFKAIALTRQSEPHTRTAVIGAVREM